MGGQCNVPADLLVRISQTATHKGKSSTIASTLYAAEGYQITRHSGEASPFAQCTSSVEQLVVHDEPAAERDEQAASLQADEEWASAVEWNLHAPMQNPNASSLEFADSADAPGTREAGSMSDAIRNSVATPRVF